LLVEVYQATRVIWYHRHVDLLIAGGTVVTCDERGTVEKADVLVRAGIIASIGADARRRAQGVMRVIDAENAVVMPGIVQAHVHLCQVLFRGMADDMPLLQWLEKRIWPLEAAHDPSSLRASAELGILELLSGGTTTILDMGTVHHHDVVMQACEKLGIRAISGKAMMDAGDTVPRALREQTKQSLAESDRLARDWHGAANGRLRYAYAPRFILSCTQELIRSTAARAAEQGLIVHTHAAEQIAERRAVREALGDDDIALLRAWGVRGERAVIAHGVQLTDAEACLLAEDGTRIVHCPSANMKLGSGIARVADLDRVGVQLALGCDGAPCNNNLDAWIEMRHAALGAKVKTGTTSLPAERVVRLATIDGARALGLDAEIGSIEVGKKADLVVVRTDQLHAEPGGDPYSRLVYACKSSDVMHVLVGGEILIKDGRPTRMDAEAIVRRAREQARKVQSRAL
jgi:cytosine/adenosine deaminase-related metal-dependent hydrolase